MFLIYYFSELINFLNDGFHPTGFMKSQQVMLRLKGFQVSATDHDFFRTKGWYYFNQQFNMLIPLSYFY